jgi:glutamate 5-kinase
MEHPLEALLGGGRCTWFLPAASPLTARKRWIAATVQPVGAVVIDAGAAAALGRGRSLLPAGVAAVEGRFERGDAVALIAPDGAEIGRGLVAYNAEDARLILGHKSRDIEARLGYRGREELIHRDDLVLTGAPPTGTEPTGSKAAGTRAAGTQAAGTRAAAAAPAQEEPGARPTGSGRSRGGSAT